MSISPRQNFWKPPPVPEMPTVTFTPAVAFWNSSATASLIGNTVLDPSSVTRVVPPDEDAPLELAPPPQAASANTSATTDARLTTGLP